MENQQIIQQPTKLFSPNLKLNTIQEIILHKDSLKSIAVLRKENDLFEVKVLVTQTITDIFKFYRESYTPSEIEYLTESTMRIGYMLSGPDLGLFKQKAIEGEYKNRVQIIDGREFRIQFFRLSPDVYLDWFQEYIFQRGEAFANESVKQKQEMENEPVSEKAIDLFKDLAKVFEPKEGKFDHLPVDGNLKPTSQDTFDAAKAKQKQIEAEFNNIWVVQNRPIIDVGFQQIPYIELKGKRYFENDYLKIMFEK